MLGDEAEEVGIGGDNGQARLTGRSGLSGHPGLPGKSGKREQEKQPTKNKIYHAYTQTAILCRWYAQRAEAAD